MKKRYSKSRINSFAAYLHKKDKEWTGGFCDMWEDLGEGTRERYRRLAKLAIDYLKAEV